MNPKLVKMYEDDNFSFYSTSELNYINKILISKIKEKILIFKTLLNRTELDRFYFRSMDSIKDYKKEYKSLFKKDAPEYTSGWFDSTRCIATVCLDNTFMSDKDINNHFKLAIGDLFGSYFKKYSYEGERIGWFDQGMMLYYTKYDNYSDADYRNLFLDFLISKKELNLNDPIVSVLAIKYLYFLLGPQGVNNLVFSREGIINVEEGIISNMVDYCSVKFNNNANVTR